MARLDEISLCPFGVHSVPGRSAGKLAGNVVRFARRKVGHAHVLRAEGEEVVHRRVVVPLHVRAEKLPSYKSKRGE